MKIISPSLLAISFLIFSPAANAQAVEAKTDPVGVVEYTINQGFNAVGISLLNPPVGVGAVASVGTNTITPAIPTGQSATNFGSALETGKFYYLEITEGVSDLQYEGERFEIDVAATKAANPGVIVFSTTSPRTTIPGNIPTDLPTSNPTFVIRPHVTISQVFGVGPTAKLNGTGSSATADQVVFFENGGFSKIAWYFKSGANDFWRSGSSNLNNEPISPGVGILVKRVSSTPAKVALLGDVRTNHFSQPLIAGWNFVAESRPVDRSPVQRALLDSDIQGNWTGTGSSGTADQIVKFVSGSFSEITWYFKSGSNNSWRRGSTLVNNDTSLLSGTGAFLFLKRSPAPNYYIPNQLPAL